MLLTPVSLRRALCALAVLSLSSLAHAALRRVPSQYPTIQAAVNASVNGDTVLVADGTYSGVGNYNISLGVKNLVVQSESNNPASCVINCQQLGQGFYINGFQNRSTVIRGFTITNGKAFRGAGMEAVGITIAYCNFVSNVADGSGGGLFSINCNVTGCRFIANVSNANLTFINGVGSITGGGGAICDADSTFNNCLIQQNRAVFSGGMFIQRNTTAIGCIFVDNTSFAGINGVRGPGAISDLSGSGTEINCQFIRNTGANGGAIFNTGNSTQINCTFYGNTSISENGAIRYGGAAYNFQGGRQVNCIFYGDSATSGTGNEVYNNGGGIQSYCLIAGLPATRDANGNFGGNPLFVNAAGGNLHISPGSPAINAGTNVTIPDVATDFDGFPRITGSYRDIGAYEMHSVIITPFVGSYRLGQPFGNHVVSVNVYNPGSFTENNVTITSVTVSGVNSLTPLPLNFGAIATGGVRSVYFQFSGTTFNTSGYYYMTVKGTSSLGPFTSTQQIYLQ